MMVASALAPGCAALPCVAPRLRASPAVRAARQRSVCARPLRPRAALPLPLAPPPPPPRPARLIASVAVAPPVSSAPPVVATADTAFLMLGWVACALAGALAACLLAAVPALVSLRRAADELAALAASVRNEVPDTAAAVRLSGLELSDAIGEVGGLTAEVGQGIRSSARALAAAEAGVRAVGSAVRTRALPAVKRRLVPAARSAAQRSAAALRERAEMEDYSGPALAAAAEGTAAGVAKLRQALQAAGIARRTQRAVDAIRTSLHASQE